MTGRVPLPLFLAGVIVALAVGGFAGALVVKRQQAEPEGGPGRVAEAPRAAGDASRPAGGSSSPAGPVSSGGGAAPAAGDREEVAKLKARIVELEALVPREPTREERIAFAKEMMANLRQGKRNPEAFRKALEGIAKLHPDMFEYFLSQFRDASLEENDREMALELGLACGGQGVADFLNERFNDPALEEDEMRDLVRTVAGGRKELFSITRVPVSGPLQETAFRWATSADPTRRVGGAGLLGGVSTLESRTTLRNLAEADVHEEVRAAAILALGYAGDQDTLTWLSALPANPENRRFTQAVEAAMAQLKARLEK